jgi:predicted DNA-binding transcriptional regulator AlpA
MKQQGTVPHDNLIPEPVVRQKTGGLGRTTRWRLMRAGDFPRPVKVGWRDLWSEREIDEWIARRLAERGTSPEAA